jgi:hypothetical protein
MKARPWLDRDDLRLIAMILAGTSTAEIGQMLGRSRQAIHFRCFLLRHAGRLPPSTSNRARASASVHAERAQR